VGFAVWTNFHLKRLSRKANRPFLFLKPFIQPKTLFQLYPTVSISARLGEKIAADNGFDLLED
jgi:hypothetical protein